MSGKELHELSPTGNWLGRVTHLDHGRRVIDCAVAVGNVPGTAVVMTDRDDPFYTGRKLAALNLEGIDKEKNEAHIELLTEGKNVLTEEPAVFHNVLQLVLEEAGVKQATISLTEGTSLAPEVFQQAGATALSPNTIKFELAA